MYVFQFDQVSPYLPMLFAGLLHTFLLTFVSMMLGLGIVLAIYVARFISRKTGHGRGADVLIAVYIDIFQSIPVLVGLVWVYFCFPALGLSLSSDIAAELVLGISLSAFCLDLLISAERAIPEGEVFAARIHGMSDRRILTRIYAPRILRTTLDPFVGQAISLLKLSTFASVIGSEEILAKANAVIARTYRPLEVYTIVALLFVLAIVPLNLARRAASSDLKVRSRLG